MGAGTRGNGDAIKQAVPCARMRSPSYSLALEIEDEIQVEEIQWQHRCSQLTKCVCLTTDPPPHQVLTSPDFFFFCAAGAVVT